ncbi:hypothetical protein [Microvirga thermotolerans]|uniref:hypothetical protein n=1 Tax=Microvirga thermotolerans TaxID=2651334 RepID=UPI003CCD31F2
MPRFVTAPQWEFAGRVDGRRQKPLGFDEKAAATGVRFNGFYLFASFQERARGAHGTP